MNSYHALQLNANLGRNLTEYTPALALPTTFSFGQVTVNERFAPIIPSATSEQEAREMVKRPMVTLSYAMSSDPIRSTVQDHYLRFDVNAAEWGPNEYTSLP